MPYLHLSLCVHVLLQEGYGNELRYKKVIALNLCTPS